MATAADYRLNDLVLVAFDTETTGLSARDGRIVEIAGIKFNLHGELLGSFTSLINPGIPIPPDVVRVHGITDAEVRGWPSASVVLREFFHFVGGPETVLVAHNAPFDIGFVREELMRNDADFPEHGILCTLSISRKHFPFLGSHALGVVARALGITVEMQHRAFADSLLVRDIAAKVLNTYPTSATLADVKGAQLRSLNPIPPAPVPGQSAPAVLPATTPPVSAAGRLRLRSVGESARRRGSARPSPPVS